MKENTNRTNLSLKLDSGLVSFLKTQENHKFSRFGISRMFSQIYRTGKDMALEQTDCSEIYRRA